MIKAPFNFVPLPQEVFTPKWADQISHDIPFEDGVSGSMDIEITAESPIFIRNGHTKEEGTNHTGDYQSFSKAPDGRYFIPATSIKGCIRNVLEILSMGKMRVDETAKFAQREWNNSTLYPLKNPTIQNNMSCGWLYRRGNEYFVSKCKGNYKRIAMSRIDEWFETNEILRRHFSASSSNQFDLNQTTTLANKEYDPKTASFKYALLREAGINKTDLKGLHFSNDETYNKQSRGVVISDHGEFVGTLVLTGSPDKAKHWYPEKRDLNDGKYFEFVFPNEIEKEIKLSKEVFDNYKFIYADSDDWKDWQSELDKDGIPVFFRYEQNMIIDLGLALLYRLPYSQSVIDIERKREAKKVDELDLAECIFGTETKRQSLKGRVLFSNCFSDNAQPDTQYTLILNGPKASYYPIYIEQSTSKAGEVGKYNTYNDGNLAGWKRYHLRDDVWQKSMNNTNLDTVIYPLRKGTIFNGKVKFHNLKVEELGALLSALTFHGNSNICHHQIGQAKPYGFGKIALNIKKIDFDKKDLSTNYAMARFEYMMNQHLGKKWTNHSSIIQLMTIANRNVPDTDQYKYMTLDVDNRANEFVDNKGGVKGNLPRYALQRFSDILGYYLVVPSLSEPIEKEIEDELKKIEEQNAKEAERLIDETINRYKESIESFINSKDLDSALNSNTELRNFMTSHLKDASICDEYSTKIEKVRSQSEMQQSTIADVIKSLKYGTIESMIKKWMVANSKSELTENDKSGAIAKLKELFEGANNKDKKEFDKSKAKFESLFGTLGF